MAGKRNIQVDAERMRSYSTVFSSTSFAKLLATDDYSFIESKIQRYDKEKVGAGVVTYLDYITYIYKQLQQNYRCEYIYKNTVINQLLLKKYGTKDTLVVNEFKVGNSVADLVLFNGTSKAFEIKTELDSARRLENQLCHYTRLFKECYIVTHENLLDKYSAIPENIGILVIKSCKNGIKLEEIRPALANNCLDASMLMRSIRTSEYKNIVKAYYRALPAMNSFNMFETCYGMIRRIPEDELHGLFVSELKKRRSNTKNLRSFHKEIRQLCLSMNLSLSEYQQLENKLSIPINI
ncbi:MAG: sce7726 family protein [Tannerellaceae bacterium]|nr:sce7726 family protein [Tannerellaceae bacterium]